MCTCSVYSRTNVVILDTLFLSDLISLHQQQNCWSSDTKLHRQTDRQMQTDKEIDNLISVLLPKHTVFILQDILSLVTNIFSCPRNFFSTVSKTVIIITATFIFIVCNRFYSLPDDKILDRSKSADDKLLCLPFPKSLQTTIFNFDLNARMFSKNLKS